jgi:hypothetical protein
VKATSVSRFRLFRSRVGLLPVALTILSGTPPVRIDRFSVEHSSSMISSNDGSQSNAAYHNAALIGVR